MGAVRWLSTLSKKGKQLIYKLGDLNIEGKGEFPNKWHIPQVIPLKEWIDRTRNIDENEVSRHKNWIYLLIPPSSLHNAHKLYTQELEFTHAAVGWAHALVAFKDRQSNSSQIFSWGLNTSGQLGFDVTTENHGLVQNLPSSFLVNSLHCGRIHSLVSLKRSNGRSELYAFGDCMYGQLGIGKSKNRIEEAEKDIVFEPIPRCLDLKGNVKQVACGLDHSIILTDQNILYAMGWGADGQLGIGSTSDKDVPTIIPLLSGKPVKKIASSTDFTFALLDNGELWSWGNSEYGQCMTGKKVEKILEPVNILTNNEIIDIAAGGPFGLYLTGDGEVYSCGYGSIGFGKDVVEILTPTRIPSLHNIVEIWSTSDYALAKSDLGKLYIWGLGFYGDNLYNPTKVEFQQKDLVIEKVACGIRGAIIIANETT
ncbi:4720_t:CDS:2 [Paraglomus brasilianum]|uniref:4720_t:CDS:1 n=1 Tax=Paraglomus brasilianum TaxID=144538 RepID=A0A9N9CSN0_9GLOM|nr:4720_t:CDS:2 [Paraglomus brasilianum]